MNHIISFSGGLGSFAVACWVKEHYPSDNIVLVFTDTNFEDEDLYRFNAEVSEKLGLMLITLNNHDKLDPLTLMEKDNYLYNSHVANCSKKLKSKVFREWLKFVPAENNTLYFGIGFDESHRRIAIQRAYSKYMVEFPLIDNIVDVNFYLKKYGIKRPRLYDMGFSHNNCGGRCIKGGIGHWINLFKKDYERFSQMRDFETKMNIRLNKHHQTEQVYSYLKRYGSSYTLEQLETDFKNKGEQLQFDFGDDIGGCGCFVDYDTTKTEE